MSAEVSKRFDELATAIGNLSGKMNSIEANVESKIDKLPERLSDLYLHLANRLISIRLIGMMFGIIAGFAIPTIFWMLRGRKIEACEVWLFSILFISFCAFGIVLIRILVRPND